MSTLLVASAGGHLKQLYALAQRLDRIDPDTTWVTFDTAQSRSLLRDERVLFVPDQPPRAVVPAARNAYGACRLLAEKRFDRVVSTGAGIALSFLPAAALLGAECYYIESATRVAGPSLTGRILSRVPGIKLRTQSTQWAKGRWVYAGSIFDGFEVVQLRARPLRRVVVTLGTQDGYPFTRMVRRLERILGPQLDVFWQTGVTDLSDPTAQAHHSVPSVVLEKAMREADLVISHAGTGSALSALEAGKCPVLVPRRAEHGEHVDDHQVQIAADLASRGLAIWAEADRIDAETLASAACRSVRTKEASAVLDLAA